MKNGTALRKAIVITFDDGYADNFYNAKPLLERFGCPATVYIRTAFAGADREFISDELDRLLFQQEMLPKKLRLAVGNRVYEWELGEADQFGGGSHAGGHAWNILESDQNQRQVVYRALYQLLRPLPDRERQSVLEQLRLLTGAVHAVRPSHRALTWPEIVQMAAGGLVEIGAHTATHPVLAGLPADEQRTEIRESKADLEQALNRPVFSFAYPYGSRVDYTQETAAIVKEEGFTCACSAFPDVISRHTDLFQLPRICVRNWDGDEFAKQLSHWPE